MAELLSLLAGIGSEMLLFFPFYLLMALVTFLLARWCMKWKAGRVLCSLALLLLAAGAIYGLLRAGEVILYPDDWTWSGYFHNTSNRQEGIPLIARCGLAFAVILFTGRSRRIEFHKKAE